MEAILLVFGNGRPDLPPYFCALFAIRLSWPMVRDKRTVCWIKLIHGIAHGGFPNPPSTKKWESHRSDAIVVCLVRREVPPFTIALRAPGAVGALATDEGLDADAAVEWPWNVLVVPVSGWGVREGTVAAHRGVSNTEEAGEKSLQPLDILAKFRDEPAARMSVVGWNVGILELASHTAIDELCEHLVVFRKGQGLGEEGEMLSLVADFVAWAHGELHVERVAFTI
ncbi:hypothetical protein FPOAC1_003874 [Fusarium poae]|uniref:hypothetical protein n=1 Tax=Fusarium poae TaxID=36050 RepID=UPI001CE91831|nr:hypothetical protein FPOAC1_003874 [Fusarium poae]KAG8677846.1 hypothetical protein FPOAC1_003874 [Fusarium poae]